MRAEHLLDAMGLLDDDLIQEAEEYRRPRSGRSYGAWLGWAASFAVVLVLGYGLTHLGMGGGNSMAPAGSCGGSTPAASAPSGEAADQGSDAPAESENQFPSNGLTQNPGAPESGDSGMLPPGMGCDLFGEAVELFGMESGQIPAIMVDGTVYWYTSATAVVRPDGLEVRDNTSYTQGIPEEDGQINFPKEGVRYVVLEEGRVGVNWNGSYEWKVFAPEPPQQP